jgi:hypothetical protein
LVLQPGACEVNEGVLELLARFLRPEGAPIGAELELPVVHRANTQALGDPDSLF